MYPEPSIALITPPPYAFGTELIFDWEVGERLTGKERALIYVEAFSTTAVDENGDPVKLYGELGHADSVFKLGGGSSLWHIQRDDANCKADLRIYGGKPYARIVAGPIEFFASGE